MIVIETCPNCGNDLITVQYSCMPPVIKKTCSVCGFYTDAYEEKVIRIPYGSDIKLDYQSPLTASFRTETSQESAERTFGDVWRDFKNDFPEIYAHVNDWRPVGPNRIQLWMDDGTIYHFDDKTKEIKIGQNEYF